MNVAQLTMRYVIISLWDVKRKPGLFANAPPIPACAWPHAERDGFPAYVDQPGPSADDYIRGPDYPAADYC
jgi:hypothetical protein